jgi:hypothetical protein
MVFSVWYVPRFCNGDTSRVNRFHGPFKVIAFNENGIRRQRCELSKQLQHLHIDVVTLSETHLKPHGRFFIPNYHFTASQEEKTELPLQLENAFHITLYLPPPASIEATRDCIPIGNTLNATCCSHQATPGMMRTSLSS